jgi:hypothetical protein
MNQTSAHMANRVRIFAESYWLPTIISLASLGVLVRACFLSGSNGIAVSRAGSIITTLGLVFALSQYRQLLAEKERSIVEAITTDAADKGISEKARTVQKTLKKVHSVAKRKEKILAIWEGLIIIIGTLTWGFGDVVYQDWQRHVSWLAIFAHLWRFGVVDFEVDPGWGPS